MKALLLILVLFNVLSLNVTCGVNTGNPGGKAPPQQPRPEPQQAIATVSLSLRPLSNGTVLFKASQLTFVKKGLAVNDPSNVLVTLPESVELATGMTKRMITGLTLPAGDYDRLVVTVEPNSSASFIDASQKVETIGLAPFRYYPETASGDESMEQRVLFDFAEDPLLIRADKRQAVVIRSDFKANVQSLSELSSELRDYFVSVGQIGLRYALYPKADARPLVTDLPAEDSGEVVELDVNLELKLQSNDPELEFIEVCIYEGKVTAEALTADACQLDYYDFLYLDAERQTEDGAAYFLAEFLLEAGEYTLAVFRENRDGTEYELIYRQEVGVEADKLTKLPAVDL